MTKRPHSVKAFVKEFCYKFYYIVFLNMYGLKNFFPVLFLKTCIVEILFCLFKCKILLKIHNFDSNRVFKFVIVNVFQNPTFFMLKLNCKLYKR